MDKVRFMWYLNNLFNSSNRTDGLSVNAGCLSHHKRGPFQVLNQTTQQKPKPISTKRTDYWGFYSRGPLFRSCEKKGDWFLGSGFSTIIFLQGSPIFPRDVITVYLFNDVILITWKNLYNWRYNFSLMSKEFMKSYSILNGDGYL